MASSEVPLSDAAPVTEKDRHEGGNAFLSVASAKGQDASTPRMALPPPPPFAATVAARGSPTDLCGGGKSTGTMGRTVGAASPLPTGKAIRQVPLHKSRLPSSVVPFPHRRISAGSLFTPFTEALASHRGGAGGRRLHHFPLSVSEADPHTTEEDAAGVEGGGLHRGFTAPPSCMPRCPTGADALLSPPWEQEFPQMNLLLSYHDVAVTEMALLMAPEED